MDYNLADHPDDDHEHRAAIMPCKRCGATPGGAKHDCYGLKPMSLAPEVAILAVHYERGPLEIKPDDQMNYWTAHISGERSWFVIGDDESPSIPDSEFDGWIAESAE